MICLMFSSPELMDGNVSRGQAADFYVFRQVDPFSVSPVLDSSSRTGALLYCCQNITCADAGQVRGAGPNLTGTERGRRIVDMDQGHGVVRVLSVRAQVCPERACRLGILTGRGP